MKRTQVLLSPFHILEEIMKIYYTLSGFSPKYGFTNGENVLEVNWNQIFHAAVTVGRKCWDDVLFHNYYSVQEIYFRLHMISAFLSNNDEQIQISSAFQTLDPSEKVGINYFFGCVFTNLFAKNLFDSPWIMHLDVYKHNLYNSGGLNVTTYNNGRSRPDFVGVTSSNEYNVFESKGRVQFSNPVLDKAYNQAKLVKEVNGKKPNLKLGCLTYHENQYFRMAIKDPEDSDINASYLKVNLEDFFFDYYASVFNLISEIGYKEVKINDVSFYVSDVGCGKFKVGIVKYIFEHLKNYRRELHKYIDSIDIIKIFYTKVNNYDYEDMFIGNDGILVKVSKDKLIS
jgi:hypothetical protein